MKRTNFIRIAMICIVLSLGGCSNKTTKNMYPEKGYTTETLQFVTSFENDIGIIGQFPQRTKLTKKNEIIDISYSFMLRESIILYHEPENATLSDTPVYINYLNIGIFNSTGSKMLKEINLKEILDSYVDYYLFSDKFFIRENERGESIFQ